jgi:hypothetical protein
MELWIGSRLEIGRRSESYIYKQIQTYMINIIQNNKSAIYLRIWKGHQFENTLKSDRDSRPYRKIVQRGKIYTPNSQIHDHSPTGTSVSISGL